MLIKPLEDAIAAGDPIHAIIRNSACNHGGRSEGITMPNGVAHRELLMSVHQGVGLNPGDTAIVEVYLPSFYCVPEILRTQFEFERL